MSENVENKVLAVLEPIAESSGLSILDPSIYYTEPGRNIGDKIDVVINDDNDTQEDVVECIVTGICFRPYTEILKLVDDNYDTFITNKESDMNYGDNPWTWCYLCCPTEQSELKVLQ